MAKPSALPYLESAMDMLDVLADRTPTDFSVVQGNRDVADAMLLRIQVAGENLSKVRSLFPEIYERHSSDSWNRLIAIRNIISHGYAEVDVKIVWDVAAHHLDEVRTTIAAAVAAER